MLHRQASAIALRGLLAAAAALLVSLPGTASALPRDRIAARRLVRILPPGSTLTLPATPVPARRPAVVLVPVSPAASQPRILAAPSAPVAVPQAVVPPAAVAPAVPPPQPAAGGGVQQAAGRAPAAKTATPAGAWTLDDAPAADGTKSVLVSPGQTPTPAAPIELLPQP